MPAYVRFSRKWTYRYAMLLAHRRREQPQQATPHSIKAVLNSACIIRIQNNDLLRGWPTVAASAYSELNFVVFIRHKLANELAIVSKKLATVLHSDEAITATLIPELDGAG